MADNTPLAVPAGSSAGDNVRSLDRAGIKTQVVQLDIGGAAAESLVTGTLPVSGTVTVANASLAVTGQFWQATQPVSGTFFQATQPVSGPVTDAQLRATAVPVSLAVNTPVIAAGAAVIGKVGIDQTTPGTTNAVAVTANSLVSTANSSTANLGVGAIFTGTSEDVSEYSTITISLFTSHVSATDGLSLQQSSDGTNWDQLDAYTIPAATGKSFQIPVQGKFFRLVYTNGATLTTSLRIQTIFSKTVKRGSSHRPQDARTNENDFEEVAAYLQGFNGTSWDRLRSTIANGLSVDVTRLSPLVAGAAVIGSLTANQSINKAQINGVAVLMGNGVTGTGSQRVTIASDNTAFPVNATGPALTKGTQGATGYSTQDLKDAGRVIFSAAVVIAGVTTVTTEALLSMVPTRDGVAAGAATTFAVTANKRLRITGITVGFLSTAVAVLSMRFALRMNPGGAVTATSPILRILALDSGAALAQAGNGMTIDFPDGIEFSGTHQFGITQIGSAITGTCWVSVTGFEY